MHPDLKGHSGDMMLLGKGAAARKSSKHRINLRSSTESEIIGVDNHMIEFLWTLWLRGGQGFKVNDNIVYQDNQSAILMERNRKYLCGKKTCHIDMRYFFINDRIEQKEVSVGYCPTKEITGEYFTRPLQGALFH